MNSLRFHHLQLFLRKKDIIQLFCNFILIFHSLFKTRHLIQFWILFLYFHLIYFESFILQIYNFLKRILILKVFKNYNLFIKTKINIKLLHKSFKIHWIFYIILIIYFLALSIFIEIFLNYFFLNIFLWACLFLIFKFIIILCFFYLITLIII
jgi:hypothetical protein